MTLITCTVHANDGIGYVPYLSHAVMGDMSLNLLRTGVRLQKTLEEMSNRPLLRRTMGTLSTGIGIDKATGVYQEDANGTPIYDFTIMDQILAPMVGPRSIPFFGLCFMPEALSRGSKEKLTQPWMKIDRFPPKDYGRWYDLVYAVVRHYVERYGAEEVNRWYWDFWNEPDLEFYWLGTHEEFFKTYDYAAAAVKAALPTAKVGGCGVTDRLLPIFKEFLEHCMSGRNYCTGRRGVPLDFITFHMKGGPTGKVGIFSNPWEAKGYERRSPSLKHIIDCTRTQLQTIASVPGTKGLPVFLTECDIDWGTGTSIYHNPNMHYRNSEYFSAFECALTRRMLDLRAEFPANPIEATFLDTFYFPGYRIFEGQRTLITGEVVEKPILNALRLLGKLGPERLAVTEPVGSPVEVLATTAENDSLQVMVVNFNEDVDYNETHSVRVHLQDMPTASWRVRHYRIDRDHSNAYTVWLSMGRPVVPTDEQLAAIQARMGLEMMEPEYTLSTRRGDTYLETTLPPHAVSLWMLDKA